MFKKIGLFFITIASMFALVSGCTNVDVKDLSKMEFINFPQSTYMMIDESDIDTLTKAYNTLLGEITIKITTNNGVTTEMSLLKAISENLVSITTEDEIFDAKVLTTEGIKTMVITLGSNKRVKLTYVFSVVKNEQSLFAGGKGTESDPYQIATPQQFMNLFARYFGVPVPSSDNELAWMYYYQFSFPYFASGKYYKITNDLDFTGITFRPLGALGGINYIPFTGTIDGEYTVGGQPRNHKIKNVKIDYVGDYAAIFAGLSDANIKNIDLENIDTGASMAKYTAGLVAYAIPSIIVTDENITNQSSKYAEKINEIGNVNVKSSIISGRNRSGAIVAKMVATEVINSSADINTKVIGYGQVGGLVAHPTSNNFYMYSKRTADSINVNAGVVYVNLNDIRGSTFLGEIVANSNGDHVGKLFGYGAKGTEPFGFIGTDKYTLDSTTHENVKASILSKNTYADAVLHDYVVTNTEVVKYSILTTGNNSNRVFSLPDDLSLELLEQLDKEATYNSFYTLVDNVWTLDPALEEINAEELEELEYAIIGNKIFVNNRIALVDVDGNVTGSLYYPIQKFDTVLKIYYVNNKLVGIIPVSLT